MRITSTSIDTSVIANAVQSEPVENKISYSNSTTTNNQYMTENESNEVSKEKLQQAVKSMNELLEINHNSSKFVFHEGLERYYVTVVDKDTDKVIKEIPPKKLLDAFYEMQKLIGMIVDEKI